MSAACPKLLLSLDLDGVLYEGGYVPPQLRTQRVYEAMSPCAAAIPIVQQLYESNRVQLAVLTARSHPRASLCETLLQQDGFPQLPVFYSEDYNFNKGAALAQMRRKYNCTRAIHLDDDAWCAGQCDLQSSCAGWLFYQPYPSTIHAMELYIKTLGENLPTCGRMVWTWDQYWWLVQEELARLDSTT